MNVPELFLFNQDRKTCIGYITDTVEYTEDVRFNACSEISFTVPEYVYDTLTEKWEKNHVFDDLQKNKLIYVNDDTDYFEYPVRTIGDSFFYQIIQSDIPPLTSSTYDINPALQNFQLQKETELFDIGSNNGYSSRFMCIIANDTTDNRTLGSVVDFSIYHPSDANAAAQMNPYGVIDYFIPVKNTDIIALRNGHATDDANSKAMFGWASTYYGDKDSSTHMATIDYDHVMGGGDPPKDEIHRIPASNYFPKDGDSGYVKFWFKNTTGTGGSSYYNTNDGSFNRHYPAAGYVKIFDGVRKCTYIANANTAGTYKNKLHWFQIVSVGEEGDGISRTKKVSAYSYEYTLHNATFSLSGSTLPLYVPPAIISEIKYIPNGGGTAYAGVLNQIMEFLPKWKVKHVSSPLMTTYRSLDDVDDVDIYTYLTQTIQEKYNCFVSFDTDNLEISIHSLRDIANMDTPIQLSWDNSIKHFEKDNVDASYFNALRIKTGDDTYGIGLVNPTGNTMTYCFDNIKESLDYYIDGAVEPYKRKLKAAVTAYEQKYLAQLSSSSAYQEASLKLIAANMRVVQSKIDYAQALQKYNALKDSVNIFLREDFDNHVITAEKYLQCQMPDAPPSEDSIRKGIQGIGVDKIAQCHNSTLYNQMLAAVGGYWGARSKYDTAVREFNSAKSTLSSIASKFTMKYSKALDLNGGKQYKFSDSTTYLSAAEIRELQNYIVEGVWSHNNVSFSETYNSYDIYSTLFNTLDDGRNDLELRLSCDNYDFSIDTSNIDAVSEFDGVKESLRMGHIIGIWISPKEYAQPMLLEMHRNYKDENDFKFVFTTDMKRRPIEFRYADLYSTISQTSVTDNTFTFDE